MRRGIRHQTRRHQRRVKVEAGRIFGGGGKCRASAWRNGSEIKHAISRDQRRMTATPRCAIQAHFFMRSAAGRGTRGRRAQVSAGGEDWQWRWASVRHFVSSLLMMASCCKRRPGVVFSNNFFNGVIVSASASTLVSASPSGRTGSIERNRAKSISRSGSGIRIFFDGGAISINGRRLRAPKCRRRKAGRGRAGPSNNRQRPKRNRHQSAASSSWQTSANRLGAARYHKLQAAECRRRSIVGAHRPLAKMARNRWREIRRNRRARYGGPA